MREILFRGKAGSARWKYGYLVEKYAEVDSQPVFVIDECWSFENDGWTSLDAYTVDPETVGQYTGLTDKNGQKIFEGDIIKSVALSNDHNQRGAIIISPIEFWHGNACLATTYIPVYPFCLDHELEVIGNITDNSELLEEKK